MCKVCLQMRSHLNHGIENILFLEHSCKVFLRFGSRTDCISQLLILTAKSVEFQQTNENWRGVVRQLTNNLDFFGGRLRTVQGSHDADDSLQRAVPDQGNQYDA